jgi:hypothetical protein
MEPQIDDEAIRQLDQFAPASPIAAGNGSHRAMDLTLVGALATGTAVFCQNGIETPPQSGVFVADPAAAPDAAQQRKISQPCPVRTVDRSEQPHPRTGIL